MISAMSSPVNGSTPLRVVSFTVFFQSIWHDLLVDSISLGLVSTETHDRELLITGVSFISKTPIV